MPSQTSSIVGNPFYLVFQIDVGFFRWAFPKNASLHSVVLSAMPEGYQAARSFSCDTGLGDPNKRDRPAIFHIFSRLAPTLAFGRGRHVMLGGRLRTIGAVACCHN